MVGGFKSRLSDVLALSVLLGEVASDSIGQKETPEQYRARLEKLRNLIDEKIVESWKDERGVAPIQCMACGIRFAPGDVHYCDTDLIRTKE